MTKGPLKGRISLKKKCDFRFEKSIYIIYYIVYIDLGTIDNILHVTILCKNHTQLEDIKCIVTYDVLFTVRKVAMVSVKL